MKKLLPLCVLALGLGAGPAHAASLHIDGSGLLTGAAGVVVTGTAYDVRFQAGSCNAVFNGPFLDTLMDEASLGSIVGDGTATSGIQTFAVWSLSAMTAVPESSTFGLLCAGLVAVVVSLRRHTRRIVRA